MTVKSATELLLPGTYEDVWYRGEAYVERGLVRLAKNNQKEVRAVVKGTEEYITALAISGGSLVRKCTCPYAQSGGPRSPACKHMVALALVWDKERNIERPTREEIETRTITPPLVSRFDIERAFQNPVVANLEVLRLAASENRGGARPHSRLPLAPSAAATDLTKLVTEEEAKLAFREIGRWARLPSFDRYFCAGEMIAAFCEVLRLFFQRTKNTSPLVLGNVLGIAQKFHYILVQELVDASDGFHVFAEAHLDHLRDLIKKLPLSKSDKQLLEQKLWDYEVHRDDY